jgi:hypothetical protein
MSAHNRDRRLAVPRAEPGLTPAQRFQFALLEASVEETLGAGKPCVLCDRPALHAGVWFPTRRYSRYLGAAPGKAKVLVYPLCGLCLRDPRCAPKVEEAILSRRRLQRAGEQAGFQPGEFITFGTPDWDHLVAAFDRLDPEMSV